MINHEGTVFACFDRKHVRSCRARGAFGVAAALLVGACGSDQGPVVESPIDGRWALEGLFQYDVEGTVRCRWSGTLDLQQLPGGVNTIVGNGTYTFDCLSQSQPLARQVTASLQNGRLTGTDLGMTFGTCTLGAQYRRGRPEEIYDGRGFCRMYFPGVYFDVAGAWRATREVTP